MIVEDLTNNPKDLSLFFTESIVDKERLFPIIADALSSSVIPFITFLKKHLSSTPETTTDPPDRNLEHIKFKKSVGLGVLSKAPLAIINSQELLANAIAELVKIDENAGRRAIL